MPEPTRPCCTCGQHKPLSAYAPYGKRCDDCKQSVLARSTCKFCGEVAGLTVSGRPRKVCDRPGCQHQYRVLLSRSAHKTMREKRRRRTSKICPACGIRKALTKEQFAVAVYAADGTVRKWDGYCRSCRRAEIKDRYHTNPEARAKAIARAAKQRADEWERRRVDPAYDAEIRAKRRERSAARRAQARATPRLIRGPSVDSKMPRVPVGPLLAAIDGWVEVHAPRFGGQVHPGDDTHSLLCERIGVSDRTIRAWRSGARTHANLDSADRILIELDRLWWEVFDERWPADVVEQARRAWEGDYPSASDPTLTGEEAA